MTVIRNHYDVVIIGTGLGGLIAGAYLAKDGFRVLNSKTALAAYLNGTAETPLCDSWIVDSTGEYRCCRVEGDPEICKDCGYSTGYEIYQARHWRPGAIRAMLRTH